MSSTTIKSDGPCWPSNTVEVEAHTEFQTEVCKFGRLTSFLSSVSVLEDKRKSESELSENNDDDEEKELSDSKMEFLSRYKFMFFQHKTTQQIFWTIKKNLKKI